jgi:hypothetical protein
LLHAAFREHLERPDHTEAERNALDAQGTTMNSVDDIVAAAMKSLDAIRAAAGLPPEIKTSASHTMLGVLGDRGISMQAIAEWCRIPITDLHRLAEFGSPLDAGAAERLTGARA